MDVFLWAGFLSTKAGFMLPSLAMLCSNDSKLDGIMC